MNKHSTEIFSLGKVPIVNGLRAENTRKYGSFTDDTKTVLTGCSPTNALSRDAKRQGE
jgi:hypothetical protein